MSDKYKKVEIVVSKDREQSGSVEIERPLLSVLIRIGCQIVPEQAFGAWFKYRDPSMRKETIYAVCALGAASVAIDSITDTYTAIRKLKAALGWLTEPSVKYPAHTPYWDFGMDDLEQVNIFTAVSSLNDTARWTREQIADWLQSIGY